MQLCFTKPVSGWCASVQNASKCQNSMLQMCIYIYIFFTFSAMSFSHAFQAAAELAARIAAGEVSCLYGLEKWWVALLTFVKVIEEEPSESVEEVWLAEVVVLWLRKWLTSDDVEVWDVGIESNIIGRFQTNIPKHRSYLRRYFQSETCFSERTFSRSLLEYHWAADARWGSHLLNNQNWRSDLQWRPVPSPFHRYTLVVAAGRWPLLVAFEVPRQGELQEDAKRGIGDVCLGGLAAPCCILMHFVAYFLIILACGKARCVSMFWQYHVHTYRYGFSGRNVWKACFL